MLKNEKIVEVVAEGGNIVLFGVQTPERWLFSRRVIDQTPELFDDDWFVHHTDVVGSFSEALALLDRYPWFKLCPRTVHPDFRTQVLDAVIARFAAQSDTKRHRLPEWQEVCGVNP